MSEPEPGERLVIIVPAAVAGGESTQNIQDEEPDDGVDR